MTKDAKKPKSNNWFSTGVCFGSDAFINRATGVNILSSIDFINGSDMYHVSISKLDGELSNKEIESILSDFDMIGAIDDTENKSFIRDFYLPVNQH